MTAPHVVAVCGSLRADSYTRIALERALTTVRSMDGSTEFIDLETMELPVFNADNSDAGDAVALRSSVRAADAVILGSPMYHGSYSGALKNALDYCGFDEFENTTVGLLAVSGGSFPVPTLNHLRSVCRSLNAWVIPHQVAIPSVNSQIDDGAFVDPDIEDRVVTLGQRAVEYATIEPEQHTVASTENVGAED
ncbi:NADPH-dependent FMN reductase [Halocatena halophila]|uniref:NADPH-dependent FMN reductase n=1 Tax=Halocatena halophila TaxID=2814576 RepID=UPI002ED09567